MRQIINELLSTNFCIVLCIICQFQCVVTFLLSVLIKKIHKLFCHFSVPTRIVIHIHIRYRLFIIVIAFSKSCTTTIAAFCVTTNASINIHDFSDWLVEYSPCAVCIYHETVRCYNIAKCPTILVEIVTLCNTIIVSVDPLPAICQIRTIIILILPMTCIFACSSVPLTCIDRYRLYKCENSR